MHQNVAGLAICCEVVVRDRGWMDATDLQGDALTMLVAADVDGAGNVALLPGERWFLAWTLPHRETTAETHLSRQGFRSFLPRHLKTVRHARKLRTVTTPIFPRYLFVALNLDRDRWRSVNSTTGIANLFMAHDRPVPVPDGVVETLIQSTDKLGRLQFALERGQKVRLVAGPFAQALGILDRLDDAGRVEVLLEIMGGGIRVKLARTWVEHAD
ncbi:MAG: transcriptional activator RfaH [Pseudomonadota bacterium]|nr:transcriptional activator RfaH [Pseudomonadota bacterium]